MRSPFTRYAIGASYTNRPHPALHNNAAEFFGSRAKVYLDIEADSPTIATLQALLILSAHEEANIRDSRGMYRFGHY
jgi:hypothetical protein